MGQTAAHLVDHVIPHVPVQQSFVVAGAAPAYADHAIFGAFQWARVISPVKLTAPDDPVSAWVDRMLDAY